MDKNRVKLNICGTEYTIASEDDDNYVLSIGDIVNTKITDVINKKPTASITAAAVLTALEYCDSNNKSKRKIDDLRNQKKDYIEELATYKDDQKLLYEKINKLNETNNQLECQNKELIHLEKENLHLKEDLQFYKNFCNEASLKLKEADKKISGINQEYKSEVNKITFSFEKSINELKKKNKTYIEEIKTLKNQLNNQKLGPKVQETVISSSYIDESICD